MRSPVRVRSGVRIDSRNHHHQNHIRRQKILILALFGLWLYLPVIFLFLCCYLPRLTRQADAKEEQRRAGLEEKMESSPQGDEPWTTQLTNRNSHSNSDSNSSSASVSTTSASIATVAATVSSAWQFDELQTNCSACQTSFNALNRRHHCRVCGNIFCHHCSSQSCLIPPSSIVLVPMGGKKAKAQESISFSPEADPDRMLTYIAAVDTDGSNTSTTTKNDGTRQLLYGRGLEERFKLAREPQRVCAPCWRQLQPMQSALRHSNSNAMRFNHIDPTDPRRLFNSPLAFTLGHEIRKAAYTLSNLLPQPKRMGAVVSSNEYWSSDYRNDNPQQHNNCQPSGACNGVSPTLGDLDGVRIPARLLEQARGIATLTVLKGGFGLAGLEFGTGLVVARVSPTAWSAPCAIGTAGVSWGALLGAVVSDHVFVLTTDAAVEMLFEKGSVQLGADVGVALGPLGRALEADLGASPGQPVAPIYTYSMSKGLYAGISLDGKIIGTREHVNEKFYGTRVTGREILAGAVPIPPAAAPLYEALQRCRIYAASGAHGSGRHGPTTRPFDDGVMGEYGEVPQGTTMPSISSLDVQPNTSGHNNEMKLDDAGHTRTASLSRSTM
jgi:SH3 domain-containing YSC84-like protein 1